jgi:acyl carrier protein
MSHRETVASVAQALGLLDASGNLLALDSLMIVDFTIALEEKIGVEITPLSLRPEVFMSIDSVAQMLTELDRATLGSRGDG